MNGKFELRGIAPGAYHLFAWSDLKADAYRKADFMKDYDSKGKPVDIEKGARLSMDLAVF